jgi:hypothetical protein
MALQSYTAPYFGAVNGAAKLYPARLRVFLHRRRQIAARALGQKCSSTGRCKLQRAAPAQTTFIHFYAFNKIKYSNKSSTK